jgi:DNA-binding GntR family transcriptional regulator
MTEQVNEKRTIADQVCEQLINTIVKGEIPPGYKISESDLAKTYGISRGPLREAIRRLEGLRLVTRIPHVGTSVVSLSNKELFDIYDVREALEGMACRLAANRMTQEEIDELKFLLDEHEQEINKDDESGYYQKEGDFDFHYRIIQGSRNNKLIQLLCGELYHLIRLYRYRSSQARARPPKALIEHWNIVSAIEQRDGEFAEMLMRRHISAARKNIELLFEQEHEDMA